METELLFPGQERIERLTYSTEKAQLRYSYCSERGRMFSCVAKSLEDAYSKCERWLEFQDQR